MEEEKLVKKRKKNMKLFPFYEMIGLDFMFYYGIKVLFLVQIKNITAAQIVLASSLYAFIQIIMQPLISIFVDKLGKKKSLVFANWLNAICMFIVLICPNYTVFLIEEAVNAVAFGIKGITESTLLNNSIPETTKKGDIFTNIHSRGYSRYCYLYAFTTLIAGIIYDFNPYIPIILTIVVCCLAAIISVGFSEIQKENSNKKINEYVSEMKNGFKFVFKSNRLKPLLLMLGIIWGLACLFGTYQVSLLEDMNISATCIGLILAGYQVIAGRTSRLSVKFNEKFSNKSLTILLLMMTSGFILSGVASLMNIPLLAQVIIILVAYALPATSKGIYQVIKGRYLNSFTTPEIQTKIYSGNIIIENLIRMLVGFVGTLILSNFNIRYSMIIVGLIFTVIIYFVYRYAKSRLGLKPEEYKKSDLEPI